MSLRLGLVAGSVRGPVVTNALIRRSWSPIQLTNAKEERRVIRRRGFVAQVLLGIHLANPAGGRQEIEAVALAHNLFFQCLPVVPNEISEGDLNAFRTVFQAAPRPVLAYCKTGGRAKMLWDADN